MGRYPSQNVNVVRLEGRGRAPRTLKAEALGTFNFVLLDWRSLRGFECISEIIVTINSINTSYIFKEIDGLELEVLVPHECI